MRPPWRISLRQLSQVISLFSGGAWQAQVAMTKRIVDGALSNPFNSAFRRGSEPAQPASRARSQPPAKLSSISPKGIAAGWCRWVLQGAGRSGRDGRGRPVPAPARRPLSPPGRAPAQPTPPHPHDPPPARASGAERRDDPRGESPTQQFPGQALFAAHSAPHRPQSQPTPRAGGAGWEKRPAR